MCKEKARECKQVSANRSDPVGDPRQLSIAVVPCAILSPKFLKRHFFLNGLSTLGEALTVHIVVVNAYLVVTGTITISRAEERVPKIER